MECMGHRLIFDDIKMDWLSTLFASVVGYIAAAAILVFAVLFWLDVNQQQDAVRRNYPVLGRFRGLFIYLGEFFRSYFFAADREELPFNRAEREWVDHASSTTKEDTLAFGSTRSLAVPGTPIFVNSAFPKLDEEYKDTQPKLIGPACKTPYQPNRLFNISGMSYGALSDPAIKALSLGASKAGCWLNTGEGGLSKAHLLGNCDIVFQIGTAKYGVRTEAGLLDETKLARLAHRPQVKMIEIKLSQGAKPGKGGILPAAKITKQVAAIRGIPEGVDSFSPNRHPDIGDVTELLDQIDRIRRISGKPVGIKAVVSDDTFLEDLCAEIRHRGSLSAPDFITVDGGEGGTGASPMPLMDLVGLPLREGLIMTANTLVRYDLRNRIRLIASGKLITPGQVAWAMAAGADFAVSARGFMFALGCIQALKCNKNTCPTGITTNDVRLQKGLNAESKAVRVATYIKELTHEVQMIARSCGVSQADKLDRHHVRLVGATGSSERMDVLHPWPATKVPYIVKN